MLATSKVPVPVLLVTLWFFTAGPAHAQPAATRAPEVSDAAVFGSLCFQCHGAGMWSDHRSDRRGWESVLYRMVGRGAVWDEEDIRRMANYLTASFGPAASKPGGDKTTRKAQP
jgi:hypothetical protein